MSQTLSGLSSVFQKQRVSESISSSSLEDVSPFGLQGLLREKVQILKPEYISALAVTLALRGTRKQIRDDQFAAEILARRQDWLAEYQVVHLIERSLWIHGHSDLVMTLTRNPSQIPDNPPPEIIDALTKAYALHPQGTVWYGVPLFRDEVNEQGLPLPLTADLLRAENTRRITAAQQHALNWGWCYQASLRSWRVSLACAQTVKNVCRFSQQVARGCLAEWKAAHRDARRRRHAAAMAKLEYCRTGRSWTEIPEHSTLLGRLASTGAETCQQAQKFLVPAAFVGVSSSSYILAQLAPAVIVPLTIIPVDPFLFIELPEEPGKLRHLGHWYWQGHPQSERKLHLHV